MLREKEKKFGSRPAQSPFRTMFSKYPFPRVAGNRNEQFLFFPQYFQKNCSADT